MSLFLLFSSHGTDPIFSPFSSSPVFIVPASQPALLYETERGDFWQKEERYANDDAFTTLG